MKNSSSVVITGVGPLTASGSGKDGVWKSIMDKKTGLIRKKYKMGDEAAGEFYAHEIQNFDINNYGIDRQVLDGIKNWKENDEIIDLYYFLATIKMAIDDSGLKIDDKNRYLTGLILAHENMGLDHFYSKVIDELSFVGADGKNRPSTKKGFLEEFYKKFHKTGYELQTFMSLHHTAKAFNIHGFSLFLNNACASGLYAIEAAADVIRSGKCTQMIVAAVDHSSIFKHMWFGDINMCAKDGRIKPFAADRDGFTLGDGGAALVLENRDSATKRKAQIYAEYIGGDFVLEGWKVTYPDVTNDLYTKMILKAIDAAGIKPSDVDLLVPHGVGTNITDKYEARAISGVFGKMSKKPVISAFKPYIGHTLGSTALLETAIMLTALENETIPPTLNCEKLDNSLGLNVLREPKSAKGVKVTMKTACGFAGFDGACLFRVN